MHTLNPAHHLLMLSLLGVIAGAILTSSLQNKGVAIVNRSAVKATQHLTVGQPGGQDQTASSSLRLKGKSERQIKDNDRKITTFKARMIRTSQAFRATYVARIAELERRNIALKRQLNGYKIHGSDQWVESK